MSLVSYGNSDSEESDNEIIKEKTKGESDEHVIKELHKKTPNSLSSTNNSASGLTKTSLLAGLPPPKSSRSVAQAEIVEEDEVLPHSSTNLPVPILHKGGLKLPQPKKAKERQPVKITIPDLGYVDSDEDDEPVPKKIKPATGKCGLFAVLPAPKNAVTKQTTRPLVPHTLSQKHPAPVPKAKPPVSATQSSTSANKSKLVDVDSDEGEEEDNDNSGEINFFSLTDKESTPAISVSAAPSVSLPKEKTSSRSVLKQKLPDAVAKALSSAGATAMQENDEASTSVSDTVIGGPQKSFSVAEMLPGGENPVNETAYAGGYTNSYGGGYSSAGTAVQYDTQGVDVGHNTAYFDTQGRGYDNSGAYYGSYGQGGEGDQSYQYQQQEVNLLMQDQDFLKMQGKKKRGKEEIHIIDANADDVLDPMAYTKTLSVEVPYQSQKKKDGSLPTSQQRKKHQITYLAYQAKERELELKNEWSQGRMTRKQTQSKYGF